MIFQLQCELMATPFGVLASNERFGMIVYPCFPIGCEEKTLWFYVQYLENDRIMYAFDHPYRLQWFLKLISIQGIGCKMAYRILNNLTIDQLKTAIIHNDERPFASISGLSVKIAKRIIENLDHCPQLMDEDTTIIQDDGYQQAIAVLRSIGINESLISTIMTSIKAMDIHDDQTILQMALAKVNRR